MSVTRNLFDEKWGVTLESGAGPAHPEHVRSGARWQLQGLYCEGEDIVQSDPNTHHVTAAMEAMECVVVQDLFLNETSKFAHVFLPGSSFLEKDGTFTNAERRISRVRKIMEPLRRSGGLGSHRASLERARLSHALRSSVADHG